MPLRPIHLDARGHGGGGLDGGAMCGPAGPSPWQQRHGWRPWRDPAHWRVPLALLAADAAALASAAVAASRAARRTAATLATAAALTAGTAGAAAAALARTIAAAAAVPGVS